MFPRRRRRERRDRGPTVQPPIALPAQARRHSPGTRSHSMGFRRNGTAPFTARSPPSREMQGRARTGNDAQFPLVFSAKKSGQVWGTKQSRRLSGPAAPAFAPPHPGAARTRSGRTICRKLFFRRPHPINLHEQSILIFCNTVPPRLSHHHRASERVALRRRHTGPPR